MPEGDCIAVASEKIDGIELLDLATGREQAIFSGQYSIRHGFGISPDGKRICFSSMQSPGLALATLNDQSMVASIRWLIDSGIAYHASWSPDGEHVVFAWRATPEDPVQLYVADIDSDEPPKMLPGLDRSRCNVNPAWSPDGRTIVFSHPDPF